MDEKLIKLAADALGCKPEDIGNIQMLKGGMTNRSFTFDCGGKKYIMRVPGEGTCELINRDEEYMSYQKVLPLGICDDVVYLSPETGHKIMRYWEGARVCDPLDFDDVSACMQKLRSFHELKLEVGHTFDLSERIQFYESLLTNPSCFEDHAETTANIRELAGWADALNIPKTLSHIDSVPDNFLFLPDGELRLIDWEYSAMQDPHVDIAMFIVYAMYSRAQAERLIDSYFTEGCSLQTRTKIYAYIAMCGLLWSNWCEFKRQLGVEFGGYAQAQYRFAKEYYRIFKNSISYKHRASKAIILAAGAGDRLKPITNDTPKPLIKAGGGKMIESIIDTLIYNGIYEIYIVTGYLKEQFGYLPQKYSTARLKLLENPYYGSTNNISSLYMAREHLGNCIITDGDMIVHNPDILNPAFETSGYCSMYTEETTEWLQTLNDEGYVQTCSRSGGKNGWQLFSVSFWTEEDGKRLAKHLEEIFDKESIRDVYWDDIPMFMRKDEYKLKIREIAPGDLTEIDTLSDLALFSGDEVL